MTKYPSELSRRVPSRAEKRTEERRFGGEAWREDEGAAGRDEEEALEVGMYEPDLEGLVVRGSDLLRSGIFESVFGRESDLVRSGIFESVRVEEIGWGFETGKDFEDEEAFAAEDEGTVTTEASRLVVTFVFAGGSIATFVTSLEPAPEVSLLDLSKGK